MSGDVFGWGSGRLLLPLKWAEARDVAKYPKTLGIFCKLTRLNVNKDEKAFSIVIAKLWWLSLYEKTFWTAKPETIWQEVMAFT